MHPKYRDTVEELKTWSRRESRIHGAILLGSQVRKEFEGDQWSDLDVLLLVDNPQVFLQTDAWLDAFGDTACITVEATDLNWLHLTWTVKRVLFADCRTVDFSIMPDDRVDDVLSLNAEIHANGYQIIYDAQPGVLAAKIEATLACVKETPPEIPSEEKLRLTINDLLFQLIFASKKIKRQELWVAVNCINQQISRRLLELIEFHAASIGRPSQRIRYDGRFLEQRIAPGILEKLPTCFARYDAAEAIQTINDVLEMARWLAKDICEANRYPFRAYLFDRIRTLYREMFADEF